MNKPNQIPTEAYADYQEALSLVEELYDLLQKGDKQCFVEEFRQKSKLSNTGHVQFIQEWINELSTKELLPATKEWVAKATRFVNK